MWKKGELPLFRTEGGGTEELWQRREMLVALLHTDGCERCTELRRLIEKNERRLHDEEAGAVVLPVRDGGQSGGREAELLAKLDAIFGVRPDEAAIGIADRFSRLYAVLDPHRAPAPDVLENALEWVSFLQSRCEECGAPVW